MQSPVTLPCDAAVDIPNIETVMWMLNSTTRLLTYFTEDRFIAPLDYDHRYSIINDSNLVISSLNRSDSGTYECGVASPSYTNILISLVNLKVLGKNNKKL